MHVQYYIYLLQSYEHSIWPFDLSLTCIISLNLSIILHYLYLYGKNMIGKKKCIFHPVKMKAGIP